MPKVNGKKVFAAAKEHNFIIAACNFRHPNGMAGVARAARELEAPYIIELARSELGYCGFSVQSYHDTAVEMNERAGNPNPFAVHGDHITVKNTEPDEVEGARKLIADEIASGWTSLAVDASHNENEVNLRLTRELARPIVDAGLGLEVEIGEIGGKGGFSTPEEGEWFIRELVEAGIHPDLLAINNGSIHGNYGPGAGEGIQLDLTKQIADAIKPWGVAIAQHGITGTSLDKIGQFRNYGIVKGNIATLFQNLNYGIKMDPNGNAVFDENGHFIKLSDEGISPDLWEEMMKYADENDIGRGSGNVKKLNKPFYGQMLEESQANKDRINRRTCEWATNVFKAIGAAGAATTVKV
jgi:fructose-bisphosphate aldolase class II